MYGQAELYIDNNNNNIIAIIATITQKIVMLLLGCLVNLGEGV